MCQEIATILAEDADKRSDEQKDSMEVLIKVSKARRGIVSWSKSFVPTDLTRCRKKRNKLNQKTRSTVSRMLDMRKRFNTNPDKLAVRLSETIYKSLSTFFTRIWRPSLTF